MYKLRRDFNNFHLEDLNFDTKNLISFLSNNKKMYNLKVFFIISSID